MSSLMSVLRRSWPSLVGCCWLPQRTRTAWLFVAGFGMAGGMVAAAEGSTHSQIVRYSFTTLAGSLETRGSADGLGAQARFDYPFGVTVDSEGMVYVADTVNSTIRKITPAG